VNQQQQREEYIEVMTEVPYDEEEYYLIKVTRDDSFKDDLIYRVYVYHFKDEEQGSVLVGGTVTIKAENGLETLIKTRRAVVEVHELILRELLAFIHLKRAPESVFLKDIPPRIDLERLREELEDQYWIVIE
jgi:hypothetical protein